jgi:hypothetical protein
MSVLMIDIKPNTMTPEERERFINERLKNMSPVYNQPPLKQTVTKRDIDKANKVTGKDIKEKHTAYDAAVNNDRLAKQFKKYGVDWVSNWYDNRNEQLRENAEFFYNTPEDKLYDDNIGLADTEHFGKSEIPSLSSFYYSTWPKQNVMESA